MSESKKFARLLFGNGILFRIFLTIPTLITQYFACAYFVANLSDMTKATDATYIIAAMFQFFLLYWTFGSQISEFEDLLAKLEVVLNLSK